MPNIDLGSIMKKVESYSRSAKGKLRMKECIQKYSENGIHKTAGGGSIMTEKEMWEAAAALISVLRSAAQSYDLPASIMRHFDALECSKPYIMPDGSTTIYVYFGGDLHRDSLYSDGYDGIDNVIALLNNGYHAKNYVYGDWDGHQATGESKYDIRTIDGSPHIRSRKDRDGLHFINQAISDFNGNYSADFNVVAVASDDYN